MSAQKPSGSFFNQVPENSDDDKEEGNDDASAAAPIESIEELIKIRNTKPLASNPSTLGGIPTEKATGGLCCDINNLWIMEIEMEWNRRIIRKMWSYLLTFSLHLLI